MVRRLAAIFLLSICALTPLRTFATGNSEPSVEGNFEIAVEGVPTRQVEFNARTAANGTTTGEVTFRDIGTATRPESEGDAPEAFYLKARIDCLVVKDNKAILTGTVTEASAERYLDGRLVLVAVANGNDVNSPAAGKITWGFYRKTNRDWVATDSDRSPDEVNPAAWMASDFERIEDEGKVMTSDNNATVTCSSFPVSVYSFKDDEYYVNATVRLRP
jgi:hypothetical protein